MYLWDLVGHDTSEGSLRSGLGGDLAVIMRNAESLLLKRAGFAVRIVQVVPRMSVFQLDPVHVPTGHEWLGRRNARGGVHWDMRCRGVDPDLAYRLVASRDTSQAASGESGAIAS